MKMRTLIIDDEPLARGKLRRLLSTEPDIDIVGEVGDGRNAVDAIGKLSPELIFLDVQMPEMDGFTVLDSLPDEERPAVVFVTAHDRFALKAFEVHALDYLLKPFDRQRLHVALERVRRQIASRHGRDQLQDQLSRLLQELRPAAAVNERLAVKNDGRTVFVQISELSWVEAADNYVKLHVGSRELLMRETMKSIEERLAPHGFVRISRSAIIHPRAVKDIEPLFHGDQSVRLKDGATLTLCRTRRSARDQLLGST